MQRAIRTAGRNEVLAVLRLLAGSERRARKPRSAKAKGRSGVVEIRDWLLRTFPILEPDDIQIQTTSVGGQDLHLSPRATGLFPFAIESKVAEALNIWSALAQAAINAEKKGRAPIVFFRRNGTEHFVAMPLTAFERVVRRKDLD